MVRKILEKSPIFDIIKLDSDEYMEIHEINEIIVKALKKYNKKDRFKIGIVGEVKSGKSTLINALVGEDASPIGIIETTGSIIQFNNSKTQSYIQMNNNECISGDYEEIKTKVNNFGSDFSKWKDVSIINYDFNNEFLSSFTLVDTPGLQTLNKEAEKITEDIFEEIDLVIWVFNYAHFDQKDVQDKLEEFISKYPKPLIAVINKAEEVEDKEKLVMDFKNQYLYFPEIKEVFPMSALNGLTARKEKNHEALKASGLDVLLEYLWEIKKSGAKKMKYESNKEFLEGLLKKYLDFHNRILDEIIDKKKNLELDLEQEKLERDLLLGILNSKSREFALLKPGEVFEEEIHQINQYIDSLSKEECKSEVLSTQLKDLLKSIFTADLFQSKLDKYMIDVMKDIEVEIKTIIIDKHEESSLDFELSENLQNIEKSVLMDNMTGGIGIAGVSSTAPAFFQAVLGSQAASLTFFGVLPQFIIPGIALGFLGSLLLDLTTNNFKDKLKNNLDDSYEIINERFKEYLIVNIDYLEEKLEDIYQKKVEEIFFEYSIIDSRDLDIKIEQIQSFKSNFEGERIIETLLPPTQLNNNELDSTSFIKEMNKRLSLSENEMLFSDEILELFKPNFIDSISILKLELELGLIELNDSGKNIIPIYLDDFKGMLLIKKENSYDLRLKSENDGFFDKFMEELNTLEHSCFMAFYRSELCLIQEKNGRRKAFEILSNYLELKLEILREAILNEKGFNEGEIDLSNYLSYIMSNFSLKEDDNSIKELLRIYKTYVNNQKVSLEDYQLFRNCCLIENISQKSIEVDYEKSHDEDNKKQDNTEQVRISKYNNSLKNMIQFIEKTPSITKRKKTEMIINITALTCSLVAIQPIPFADIFILTPIQTTMAISLNRIMKNDLSKPDIKKVLKSILATVGWGVLSQQFVLGLYKTIIPFMGAVTTIPLVYATTYALGKVLVAYFDTGSVMSQSSIKNKFKEELKVGRKVNKNLNPKSVKREYDNFTNEIKEAMNEYNNYIEVRKQNIKRNDFQSKQEMRKNFKARLNRLYPNIKFTDSYISNIVFLEMSELEDLEREYEYAKLDELRAEQITEPTEIKLHANILIIENKNNRIVIDIMSEQKKEELNRFIDKTETLENENKHFLSANEELKRDLKESLKRDTYLLFMKFKNELNTLDNITVDTSVIGRLDTEITKDINRIKEDIHSLIVQIKKEHSSKNYWIRNLKFLGKVLIIKKAEYILNFNKTVIQNFESNRNLINKLSTYSVIKFYHGEEMFVSKSTNYDEKLLPYPKIIEKEMKKFDYFMNQNNYSKYKDEKSISDYYQFIEKENRKNSKYAPIRELNKIVKDLRKLNHFRSKRGGAHSPDEGYDIVTKEEYLKVREISIKKIIPKIIEINL